MAEPSRLRDTSAREFAGSASQSAIRVVAGTPSCPLRTSAMAYSFFDTADFRSVFRRELEDLKEAVARTEADANRAPWLAALTTAALADASVVDEEPVDPRYDFFHEWPLGHFHFSDTFLKRWQDYFGRKCEIRARAAESATSPEEEHSRHEQAVLQTKVAIQLFFLHEFLHVDQKLTSYQHQEIEKAPDVLRFVDYAADSLSIAAYCNLYSVFDSPGRDWPTDWPERLALVIESALWGMESFQFSPGESLSNLGIGQFFRYVAWHYQLHRAKAYNADAAPKSFRLASPPSIDIRGLRRYEYKENVVTSHPPEYLRQSGYDPPFLWIGTLGTHGLPTVYRLWPTDPAAKIPRFFEGILSADSGLTWPVFAELFDEYRDLIGRTSSVTPRASALKAVTAPEDELRSSAELLAGALQQAGVLPMDYAQRSALLETLGLMPDPEYLRIGSDLFPQALIRDIARKGRVSSLTGLKHAMLNRCEGGVRDALEQAFSQLAAVIQDRN